MGDALACLLIDLYESLDWQAELVVPVPLGVARLAERGYNQTALIARPLAYSLRLNYRPDALVRVKETRSQVDLNVHERKENVSGAFMARKEQVSDRAVLLVDDVATSGATLDSCSRALRTAGARYIYCLTLARADFDKSAR
jgi:ComF family protein